MNQKAITLCTLIILSVAAFPQKQDNDSLKILFDKIANMERDIQKQNSLSFSGYIQGQYQWGESDASLKVGSSNERAGDSFNRIGIRRGHLKASYAGRGASAVFQIDITEKGIGIKDAYFKIADPWLKSSSLKAGIFDRPFGYEISYSSSKRESPERSAIFQTLFPEVRDLGAMVSLQLPKANALSILRLDAGIMAGNGIKADSDSKKDFIGRLGFQKQWDNISIGAGTSYYYGKVYQGTSRIFVMRDGGFTAFDNEENTGRFSTREYKGADCQLTINHHFGTTKLNAEYIVGLQPATAGSSKSPNSSSLPNYDIYRRNFSGGYLMLVQQIGRMPLMVVAKHDWYDPNTDIDGNRIGLNGTSKTDLKQHSTGMGIIFDMSSDIRLTAYYDFNRNEKTANISSFDKDVDDDVFTIRLQYKF